VGPHGHWLVLLFNGYRKRFNNGEDIELEVENVFDIDKWQCKLEIPIAYLPGRVTHFNAYALHGTGNNRHYEAMSPVTDGSLDKPDFHRKEYFQRIDMRRWVVIQFNTLMNQCLD
jgi:hypothetical protein